MTSKTIAPYGTWSSPVTTELMTGTAIGLSALAADGTNLYWLESRPVESGRTVLCRRNAEGMVTDVTPQPINVGSRVHEYGGGAYAAQNGVIVYSERKDGSIWMLEGSAVPRKITTPEGCRYADFELDLPRRRVLAIREDHRDRPPTDPKASIVALPLDNGAEIILTEGPDFLSSPRLSPDSGTLAWISWQHPDMPWDATQLHVGTIAKDGTLATPLVIGKDTRESIVQPRWSPDGRLHFSSDRTGWWNLYALQGSDVLPVFPIEAEIGGPHWVFGQRAYSFLPDGRIIAAIVEKGIRQAALIAEGKRTPLELGQVHEAPVPLSAGLAFIATPPTEPPSITVKENLSTEAVLKIRVGAPSILPRETISIGEAISFPTRGTTGYAFWYAPTNADYAAPAGELPPLVVLSHGGPTSMVTNGFGLNIQWWTSHGFGVVDVNYGGSTGYGRSYRQMLNGQWGIVDVQDCIAAAASLIARGLVDAKRVVIRGGSAGGFTTLAALTSSDVFKAGASLYGVADLKLLASDTHKFESRYLDRLIGP